jgi:hypothetical protein
MKRQGFLMLTLIFTLCSLFAFVPETVAETKDGNPYSLALIRGELKLRANGKWISRSWAQKQIYRLGDLAAVALLKILNDEELVTSSNLPAALSLLQESFAYPDLISHESDRQPRVALLLLDHLQQGAQDAETKLQIGRTMELITAKTAR